MSILKIIPNPDLPQIKIWLNNVNSYNIQNNLDFEFDFFVFANSNNEDSEQAIIMVRIIKEPNADKCLILHSFFDTGDYSTFDLLLTSKGHQISFLNKYLQFILTEEISKQTDFFMRIDNTRFIIIDSDCIISNGHKQLAESVNFLIENSKFNYKLSNFSSNPELLSIILETMTKFHHQEIIYQKLSEIYPNFKKNIARMHYSDNFKEDLYYHDNFTLLKNEKLDKKLIFQK